jgi:hypothetical protein
VAVTPLPSFGLVTWLYGTPGIPGRSITDGRYWSESRTRLFGRKLRRAGQTLMRRVDTFMSVNLPPNQRLPLAPPVAYLFFARLMKYTLRSTFVVMIFSTMLFSSACQKKAAVTNPGSESKGELHDRTKPLQAADLVGYDGTRLRKSVDHIIDAKEKHDQELKKMAEGGPDQ